MIHHAVGLLNARRDGRGRLQKHVGDGGALAPSAAREGDDLAAGLAGENKGIDDVRAVAGGAQSDGHVAAAGEGLQLAREDGGVAQVVGDCG